MRAELLHRIREQIERVVQAPNESRNKILDTEAEDIAGRVVESRVKLEGIKKVSNVQISRGSVTPAFDASVSSLRARMRSSLDTPVSPTKDHPQIDKMSFDVSMDSTGPGQTTLGRLSQVSRLFDGGSRRKKHTSVLSDSLFRSAESCVASLNPGRSETYLAGISYSLVAFNANELIC